MEIKMNPLAGNAKSDEVTNNDMADMIAQAVEQETDEQETDEQETDEQETDEQETDVPEHGRHDAETAKQDAMNNVVGFDAAMQAMHDGKVARLIDNGDGMMLPGIITAMPAAACVEAVQKTMPKDAKIAINSLEMLLVNIVLSDGGNAIARFYRPRDFKTNTHWLIEQ